MCQIEGHFQNIPLFIYFPNHSSVLYSFKHQQRILTKHLAHEMFTVQPQDFCFTF